MNEELSPRRKQLCLFCQCECRTLRISLFFSVFHSAENSQTCLLVMLRQTSLSSFRCNLFQWLFWVVLLLDVFLPTNGMSVLSQLICLIISVAGCCEDGTYLPLLEHTLMESLSMKKYHLCMGWKTAFLPLVFLASSLRAAHHFYGFCFTLFCFDLMCSIFFFS